MEKIWLRHYPRGVPAEIDAGRFPSVGAILDEGAARHPDRPAFTNLGTTLRYRDVDRLSVAFGAWLQQRAGLAPGDRIALMMPNLLQYPVALFGALRAGLVVVNTNPLYTARELRHQLEDSGARAIVVLENFAHVLGECIDATGVETVVVTRMGDLLPFPRSALVNAVVRHVKRLVPAYDLPRAVAFREALAAGSRLALAPVAVGPDDVAFLQYTGGTTGVAKGAMLTHRNVIANVEQVSKWLDPFLGEGPETVVTALPLYHIFALTGNCLTFMRRGGCNWLITNPRDMRGFVRELGRGRFDAITGVNTLFNGLLNTQGFAALDFSSLRAALAGGMALQGAVAERWKAVTGVNLIEAYGLTETAPAVCINPFDLREFNGCVGLPLPSTEVEVRDEAGAPLGVGGAGELWVRGPQVMNGYWNRPDATAATIDAEGWLRTGDVATVDERGFVRIVDRKKDVILVSGFNVYPNEVEEVIAAHPAVREVGAIGVPDERCGEVVKAVVVKRNPGLTEEELAAHCRSNLTGYKRPKYFEFADDLPKSNVGKILRRELRQRFGVGG